MKRMKRVLLISFSERGSLGVRLLSSILRKEYDVSLLFFEDIAYLDDWGCREQGLPAVINFCEDFDYLLMGVITFTAPIAFELADGLRQTYPDKTLIVGGALAMVRPELCLQHADYVCLFEGEGILELLQSLDGGGKPLHHGNFICDAGALEQPLSAVRDLNGLPAPDYRNDNEYWVEDSRIVKKRMLPRRVLFQTMRGCPYDCAFCFNTVYNALKARHGIPLVRFKSMRNVLCQLASLKRQLPELEYVDFTADDNFFAHGLGELETFVSGYDTAVGIPLMMVIDLRSVQFYAKIRVLSRLKSLVHVSFGIESGSEEFNRRVYNRPQRNTEVLEKYVFMRTAFDKRVEMVGELMYCHPEETKEDVLQTLNAMLEMKGARFSIAHFLPLPGTPLGQTDSGFSSQSQSDINLDLFNRFPFYYFMIFLIKYLRRYHFDFLLPRVVRVSWLTESLNRPLFSGFYAAVIRFSVWHGELRTDKKSPVEMLGSLWRAIFPVNGWGASSGDSAAHI